MVLGGADLGRPADGDVGELGKKALRQEGGKEDACAGCLPTVAQTTDTRRAAGGFSSAPADPPRRV